MENNFIKVKSRRTDSDTYINVAHIGHIYEYKGITSIGVTTHNNGGFEVFETTEEVLKIISDAKKNSI